MPHRNSDCHTKILLITTTPTFGVTRGDFGAARKIVFLGHCTYGQKCSPKHSGFRPNDSDILCICVHVYTFPVRLGFIWDDMLAEIYMSVSYLLLDAGCYILLILVNV